MEYIVKRMALQNVASIVVKLFWYNAMKLTQVEFLEFSHADLKRFLQCLPTSRTIGY